MLRGVARVLEEDRDVPPDVALAALRRVLEAARA
jgi:hypothetical protein